METSSKSKGKVHVPSNSTDELNPSFVFSLTATELLVGIANGTINVRELAKRELANRGHGLKGTWVGFDNAKKEWRLK